MILRIGIGEECIEIDDEITDSRPTPEYIEDTLGRMARVFDTFHRDNALLDRALDTSPEASD